MFVLFFCYSPLILMWIGCVWMLVSFLIFLSAWFSNAPYRTTDRRDTRKRASNNKQSGRQYVCVVCIVNLLSLSNVDTSSSRNRNNIKNNFRNIYITWNVWNRFGKTGGEKTTQNVIKSKLLRFSVWFYKGNESDWVYVETSWVDVTLCRQSFIVTAFNSEAHDQTNRIRNEWENMKKASDENINNINNNNNAIRSDWRSV